VRNTFICVVNEDDLQRQRRRIRAYSESFDVHSKAEPVRCSPLLLTPLVTDSGTNLSKGAASPVALVSALRAGGAQSAAALGEVCASVQALSFDDEGYGVVLQALDLLGPADGEVLLAGLRGAVADASCSPTASLVLLRALDTLGREAADFVAAELRGRARDAAGTSHGCAVLCHLLERTAGQSATEALVEELVGEPRGGDVAALCCHKYGHLAAMSVMRCGAVRHKGIVADALHGDLHRYARHRFASKVLREALVLAPHNVRGSLARELMSAPGSTTALACHCFGVLLVRAMLQQPRFAKQVRQCLTRGQARLRRDRYGYDLLVELGLEAAGRPPLPATAALGGA